MLGLRLNVRRGFFSYPFPPEWVGALTICQRNASYTQCQIRCLSYSLDCYFSTFNYGPCRKGEDGDIGVRFILRLCVRNSVARCDRRPLMSYARAYVWTVEGPFGSVLARAQFEVKGLSIFVY